MKKILKNRVVMVVALVIIVALVVLAFNISFLVKIPFTEKYITVLNNGETENSLMMDYMEKRGWTYDMNQPGGGMMFFEKGEEKIGIRLTNIKTIIENGLPNLF